MSREKSFAWCLQLVVTHVLWRWGCYSLAHASFVGTLVESAHASFVGTVVCPAQPPPAPAETWRQEHQLLGQTIALPYGGVPPAVPASRRNVAPPPLPRVMDVTVASYGLTGAVGVRRREEGGGASTQFQLQQELWGGESGTDMAPAEMAAPPSCLSTVVPEDHLLYGRCAKSWTVPDRWIDVWANQTHKSASLTGLDSPLFGGTTI